MNTPAIRAARRVSTERLREIAALFSGHVWVAGDMAAIAAEIDAAASQMDRENDAQAIRGFADVMIAKMEHKARAGRTGWTRIPLAHLWAMLREQIAKGDPVDIAIIAMMIHHNREEGTNHTDHHDPDFMFTERARAFLLRPILERLETMSSTISEQQTANTAKLTADLDVIKTGIATLQDQLAAAQAKTGEVVSQEQEDAFTAAVATADKIAAAFAPPPPAEPAEPAA